MIDTPIESYPCRGCGTVMDTATKMNGSGAIVRPSLSLCVQCAEVTIIEPTPMGVISREPTAEELVAANSNPQFVALRATLLDEIAARAARGGQR